MNKKEIEALRRHAHETAIKIHERSLQDLIEEQRIYIEQGRSVGYEALYTNSSGARSAAWFKKTGKAFFTGKAFSCVAAALTHPDIGMGAGHFNTVTIQNTEQFIFTSLMRDLWQNIRYQLTLLEDPRVLTRAIVTENSLKETSQSTLKAAIREFVAISGGQLPPDTEILLGGAFFIDDILVRKLQRNVLAFLQAVNIKIPSQNIHFKLGEETGVLYGGVNHPNFNQPGFYNLYHFQPVR